jgi:hypothetical protein
MAVVNEFIVGQQFPPKHAREKNDDKEFKPPPEQKIYPEPLQDAKGDSDEMKATKQKMRLQWDSMNYDVILTNLNLSAATPKAIDISI